MGIWVLPNGQRARGHQAGAGGHSRDPRAAPGRDESRDPVRLHGLHPGRHRRGPEDPHRDAPHRRPRHLPLPRLVPVGRDPGRGDPGLARRRRLPDVPRRLHDQPPHAPRDRPLRRARRGRRHRHGRERRAAPPARPEAARSRHEGRPRAGRADHRDDDHARRGLRPDRHPGGPHRRALPRVRLHAGGRRHRLGRRGAHPLADDGLEAASVRRLRARLRRLGQPALRLRSAPRTRVSSPRP